MITAFRIESRPKNYQHYFSYVPTLLQTFNCSNTEKIVSRWGWEEAQKRSWPRHYATSLKVAGPDVVIGFFNLSSQSSCTMTVGSTQPLTEMSTKIVPVGKARPERKAGDLTVICEPTVYKIWKPRRLTIPWAYTASYRITFTFN
jgi:hypothetical protein